MSKIPFGIPTNAPDLPPGEDTMVSHGQPLHSQDRGFHIMNPAKAETAAEGLDRVEMDMKWRDLALQFDGHRIEALSLLRGVVDGEVDDGLLSEFLRRPPLSGEKVLAERIAALTAAIAVETKPVGWQKIVEQAQHVDLGLSIRSMEVKEATKVLLHLIKKADEAPQPLAVETKPVAYEHKAIDWDETIYTQASVPRVMGFTSRSLYASPQPLLDAPRVKALEWGLWGGVTPFDNSYVLRHHDDDSWSWHLTMGPEVADRYETADQAKAAAAQDYEQRIRSALQSDGEGK